MEQLKDLKIKRADLLAKLDGMMETVEVETRALTEEEIADFDALEKEINGIDATIKRIEKRRIEAMPKEQAEVEQEKLTQEELEVRAMNAFFRGEDYNQEVRTMLASTSSNQATFPLTIAKSILKRLEELCPVLEKAKRFKSKGTLRLIDETTYGEGALCAENTAFKNEDPVLHTIDLTSYKVAAQTKATFELLANSSVDLNQYLTDVIIRRLSKEINRLFLLGTGVNEPTGLINAKQTVTIGENISIDDITNMYTSMHPDFLTNAIYIMNRNTFGKIALLKDGNGHPYIQNGVINGKFTYTLNGIPIVIDNFMDDLGKGKKPIILADVNECYAVNMLQDIVVRKLDQIEFTNGVEVFAGYLMADGKIVNEDAIKVAVIPEG